MAEPRDALVAALADRVMRRSLVVLAGGSFATRHRLLQDALEGLAFQDTAQGAAYRSERRAVRVVEVDLRREPWEALTQAARGATDGARVVVLIEEAHRVRRWSPEARSRLGLALDALSEEGSGRCVVLAVEGDATEAMEALPGIGASVAGAIVPLGVPWERRVARGVVLGAAVACAVTVGGGVHDRQEIARRATMARAAAQSTHRALLAEMTLLQGFSQRRALAAAAAALELDEIDGAAEGVDALVHDRGLMRAEGPWVLRAEPRAAWTVRYLDDRRLLVAGLGNARVIDARSGQIVRAFDTELGGDGDVLSAEERLVFPTDRELPWEDGWSHRTRSWGLDDGRRATPRCIAATIDRARGSVRVRSALAQAWHAPGAASAAAYAGELLWNLDEGDVRVELDLPRDGRSPRLAPRPDGRQFAHVSQAGDAVHVWTLPPSRLRESARGAPVDPQVRGNLGEFSGDGRVARFDRDGSLSVFELGTNRRLATVVPARDERFLRAQFEGRGRTLVTRSTRGWIDRWDLTPDDPRALLREHLARTNLRVCRDGLLVVTVPPPLDAVTATSPWAPDALCASAPRSPRAR